MTLKYLQEEIVKRSKKLTAKHKMLIKTVGTKMEM
jgi:hypothetical protein